MLLAFLTAAATVGWEVGQTDGACGIVQTFEGKGDTEMTFILRSDGDAGLSLTNTGWSAVKGEKYPIEIRMDASSYTANATGIGDKYDSRKGFVILFGPDFVQDFRKSSGFRVYRGDVLVDNLSLRGSGAALARADVCLARVRREEAAVAKEKARFANIVDDPFAGASKTGSAKGDMAAWVTNDDYPSDALSAGVEGRVGYTLTVTASGRVSGCKITASSGADSLDRATCSTLTRRARFEAAPAEHNVDGAFEWKLPK